MSTKIKNENENTKNVAIIIKITCCKKNIFYLDREIVVVEKTNLYCAQRRLIVNLKQKTKHKNILSFLLYSLSIRLITFGRRKI